MFAFFVFRFSLQGGFNDLVPWKKRAGDIMPNGVLNVPKERVEVYLSFEPLRNSVSALKYFKKHLQTQKGEKEKEAEKTLRHLS